MGRGGSEATAMWTLQALQELYDVTFVTASPMDWDELNRAYGCAVDPDKINYRRAPRLPTVDGPAKLSQLQLRYFEKFCHGIAGDYDLCISAYNPINFGKPGIQLIGDFSFSEEMRKRLYVYGEQQFRHRDSLARRVYLKLSEWIGIEEVPLAERGDLVLANSEWCVDQLAEFFGLQNAPVIYPPVVLPKAPAQSERDPLSFVCLGRVVPEKEIERMVSILRTVRERGYPVTLRLIGALDDSDYSARIGELVSSEDWVHSEGFLMLEKKHSILSQMTFALHACRIEAFGIAVAEMASMGCVPFVPSTGGAREIVGHEELQYAADDEAVEKIVSLLENPEQVPVLRRHLSEEMNRFGPEVFMRELREHVIKFSDLERNLPDAEPEEDLASSH